MPTYYLDPEGGNDANDGTTFANRWKTFASGATAARTAPGDTIRVMASPDPTLVGNVTWTNKGSTVTLPAAVTADIDTCDSAWTASASVTQSNNTGRKQGTVCQSLAIAAGFTTGKVAYHATGTLDLSAYQQVSFWFQANSVLAAGVLRLCLCTDTTGDVIAHSFYLPAVGSNATISIAPVTFDNGAALNSAIQSVALYADSDPGTLTVLLDHIIACKAPSAADSLTLNSLLGKAHCLNWQASTAYSLNDIRKPTSPNRNGFAYKVTTAGTTGSSEPTWPEELGKTVTDGSVVWTCFDLEETWWPIMNISGTTVKLDQGGATNAAVTRGYAGASETVATYKREPIRHHQITGFTMGDRQIPQESGTLGSEITYSGGWNRADMSTQSGETWWDQGAGSQISGFIGSNAIQFLNYVNLSVTRAGAAFVHPDSTQFSFCHVSGDSNYGFYSVNTKGSIKYKGCSVVAAGSYAFYASQYNTTALLERCSANSGSSYAFFQAGSYAFKLRLVSCNLKNNGSIAISLADNSKSIDLVNVVTADNSNIFASGGYGIVKAHNCLFNEGIPTPSTSFGSSESVYYLSNEQQVAGAHAAYYDGGNVRNATDQRNTASGYSAKATVTTASYRTKSYPLRFSLGKFYCAANVTKTFSAMMRRSATTISARLLIRTLSLAGILSDAVSADFAASIDTWATSGNVSITPTEAGVVELFCEVWETSSATSTSVWVDDVTVS